MERPRPSLHRLRLVVLVAMAATAVVLLGLAALGLAVAGTSTVWVALPVIVGAADLILVPAVGSTVRPLPHGISEIDVRHLSARVVHAVTYLRLALAEAPALIGVLGSVAAGSLVPALIGVSLSAALLAGLVYPRRGVLDGVRERLESGGADSHLWEQLD